MNFRGPQALNDRVENCAKSEMARDSWLNAVAPVESYCSLAYSALACFRMGMSGSASFSEGEPAEHWPQPRSISGSEDTGRRDRQDEHKRWWRGLWK